MADYISRNKAINAIKNLESSMPAKDNYAEGYDAALGRVLIAVRGVPPTADVQPIRHGRWINDGDCMLCSCCNYAYNSWFMGSNYCPNCGARMDKS